ncbi:MAG: hypothetical protein ACKODM_15340 [Cytophagales bacterium]
MLRFFRFNDPYRLLFVLATLLVVGLSLYTFQQPLTVTELNHFVLGEMLNDNKSMYVEVVDCTPPLFAWVTELADTLFGRGMVARHIVALFCIFFSAAYFSTLLINNKAYNDTTYLPALVFAILCCSSFDFFQFSPQLIASIALLFALNNLFKEIEFRLQQDETILNLGLFVGIASLLVFSYIIFLPGTAAILLVFTRISLRKVLLLIVGFLLPHAMLFTVYWYGDHHHLFIQYFYVANVTLSTMALIDAKSLWVLGAVPLVYFLFSLIMLNRESRFTKYQSQLLQVMLLWMIVALAEIIFARQRTPHSFITLIPSLTYFISHYLLLIRRKRIAEIMLWLLVLGTLSVSWLARAGKLLSVSYIDLIVPEKSKNTIEGKRILNLDDDITVYQHNKVAGFFLNIELSKSIYMHPEYFENVLLMEHSFEKDAPDIILDKNDRMQPFFQRMPKWKPQYKREGDYYRRLK